MYSLSFKCYLERVFLCLNANGQKLDPKVLLILAQILNTAFRQSNSNSNDSPNVTRSMPKEFSRRGNVLYVEQLEAKGTYQFKINCSLFEVDCDICKL